MNFYYLFCVFSPLFVRRNTCYLRVPSAVKKNGLQTDSLLEQCQRVRRHFRPLSMRLHPGCSVTWGGSSLEPRQWLSVCLLGSVIQSLLTLGSWPRGDRGHRKLHQDLWPREALGIHCKWVEVDPPRPGKEEKG